MLNVLVSSGIFWTCIGVIVALIIAVCVAGFPLNKNKDINKENQKKLICVLLLVLLIVFAFFTCYVINEYKNYDSEQDKTTTSESSTDNEEETESENQSDNNEQSENNSETTKENITKNTENTTLPKIYIENKYNEDGIITNGAFGQLNYYNGFFKYDVNKQEFENFDINQVDCDFNEVKLIFINENNETINNCAVHVGVPASHYENGHDLAFLYNDTDFDNSDTVYFEDGLYRFEIIYNNEEYYSKFLTIDESKTYYIHLEKTLDGFY